MPVSQYLLAFFIMFSPVEAGSSGTTLNYCHDPQTDAEWGRLIARYEGDRDFSYLYTPRKSLCARVDEGEISLDDAIGRFESERHRILEERLRRIQQREGPSGGFG